MTRNLKMAVLASAALLAFHPSPANAQVKTETQCKSLCLVTAIVYEVLLGVHADAFLEGCNDGCARNGVGGI